jgi:pilus assembly protein CpaB
MKRNSVLIIAACLIGLITASAYSSRIRNLRDEITYMSEKIPVLTVSRNIKAGETLAAEDLEGTLFIKEQVSGRTVLPEDVELIVGRRVIHPVPAGDPILWTDFPEGPRVHHPSESIPTGYRAIALPADETHTLVHFISPGDTVDIVSSTFESSGDRLVSQLIAENIVVLGVGRQLKGRPDSSETEGFPISVTLLVDPESALAILRASQTGAIHFLARGSNPFAGIYDQNSRSATEERTSGEKP